MFAALRIATARLLGPRSVPALSDDAYADVTHLLEVVTAPLPITVGTVPAADMILDETVELEWGDGLGEEDVATDEMSEREARQVLRQAGIQLDENLLEERIQRGFLAVGA